MRCVSDGKLKNQNNEVKGMNLLIPQVPPSLLSVGIKQCFAPHRHVDQALLTLIPKYLSGLMVFHGSVESLPWQLWCLLTPGGAESSPLIWFCSFVCAFSSILIVLPDPSTSPQTSHLICCRERSLALYQPALITSCTFSFY